MCIVLNDHASYCIILNNALNLIDLGSQGFPKQLSRAEKVFVQLKKNTNKFCPNIPSLSAALV